MPGRPHVIEGRTADSPSSLDSEVFRRWLPNAVLAFVILLLYTEVIWYGYCKWNDRELVILTWSGALKEAFFGLHVRPIWYLTYAVTNAFGHSPLLDHVVNLILFVVSALLAHRVARVFIAQRKRAFLATLTWVLLPWNAYPASWIAQRNDLLIYIFGFLAILAFYKNRHGASFLYMTIAVFSKVTVAFLPLFFTWKAVRRRSFRAAFCFTGLFLGYALLAFHNYMNYYLDFGEVAQLSSMARVLVFPFHWVEHFFLLLVPLPFWVSPLQAAIYAAGFVGLAVGCFPLRQSKEEPSSLDLLVIALLTSVLSLVSSELRICGFESLFWLILLVRHVQIRRLALVRVSYALVLVSYIWSIQVTKPIFVAPESEEEGPEYFYPNGYYEERYEIIFDLMKSVKGGSGG